MTPTDADYEAAIRAATGAANKARVRFIRECIGGTDQSELARSIHAHACTLAKVREADAEIQEQARLLGKSAERELALRGEVERLREAVQHIQNAPMVVDGGSIQWCRVVAQKALENRT
ncbi:MULTISPECIES: hypothetical protein [unclassified Novosphingobium]|uniref:hypothetical protein n=1 Tax=unclassified Novosphingobium TaxID=2644732 RepID=UPI000D47BCB4|nr:MULTISPECIES: hypothetical protein [unclassified Novosphingobium]PTR06426.1 hypothetical protein C8K11_12039 [Novosphingobium sp. GV055]PUA94845.1 hypothetical protein C8K12_12039 [Novosphingobium sp. GV061]PUB13770.1 hypothetical protein C8K14_12039 [Novosphingobium sp. GV079]PUB38468.1 hypothetical protein C8K10_12039 [Novosphingobium sp. GV027]